MSRVPVGHWAIAGLLACAATAPAAEPDVKGSLAIAEYSRKVIYHSPQSPGYTCWVGCWMMPDRSIMVCFTQATGPVRGRAQGPKEVLQRLSWPPPGRPDYDMTGLDLRNVHLRSADGGSTWQKVSEDPFKSPMNGVTGECETAMPDGTVIRGVWGHYLPYNPELPQTGFLQRSPDGTKTWGRPELPLDPNQYTSWPKRLRVLKDGRLILLGGVVAIPAGTMNREEYGKRLEPLLQVSSDCGKTWSKPIAVVPKEYRDGWGGEEYDAAELPGGDLLCVFRRLDHKAGRGEVRWQGVLKKSGETWIPANVGPAPFPHSGHPELLATREGIVLHIATSGIHGTRDGGRTWQRVEAPGTNYYPHGLQTPDGRICIFAHRGSDDPYGAVDQAITMDTFRLQP